MNDDSEMAACQDCVCLASRRAARAITRVFERHLRPYGIRSTQFTILPLLILNGPMTVGALAEALGLERTTLTRNLALIQARKWVAIHPGKDARARIVSITPVGRRKAETALPAWRAAQSAVTEAIGKPAAAAFRSVTL